MKSGTRPTPVSHKDYDLHKTFGSIAPATFPPEYFCDSGMTMPDQNRLNTQFNPAIPPMPYGCTNYAQSELSTDIDGNIKNPSQLEAITHANMRGGCGIRESLEACLPAKDMMQRSVRLGWIKAFFNIRALPPMDFFDAFRLAQYSAQPEKRSISWGTPWFPSWEAAALQGIEIMPMPTEDEFRNAQNLQWHNSKLDGWTSRNGVLVYRDKSWQGAGIGFLYFPREVINAVMGIKGTVGYTASNMDFATPQRIDLILIDRIVSIMRHLLGLQ